ncbi:hypothetical protein GYM62_06495 [Algoriphagus sp. NBT04N3]|jgi:hypothetical protein|uniref:DUF6602 domain-containing protein n=1 Tax=Algoriphagus sp. NBT04N3 TaxID=2705473 RepID=UPI001C635B9A|nr:DUF6602 domain-containing protein [Algoriphagus sp. NBT04N3]QYH38464.1 hypothetical protein GYM62_06495 [Algoriphagus sp. NBT04N3]
MNEYFRSILDGKIKKALKDAELAIEIKHPYLTGRLREICLHQLIEPMLNGNYSVGSGKIIDLHGNISGEIDLCVYSKNLHPPIFFSQFEKTGLFPIESVLETIEVKSDFNLRNIRDAYAKFLHLDSELIYTAAFHEGDKILSSYFVKSHYNLFFFGYKAKAYSPEKILEIYSKVDPGCFDSPLVGNICIAGKGWFCNTRQGWMHKSFDKDTGINEEMIGFLSTLTNGLPDMEKSRGYPRIGYYLTNPIHYDKLIGDKFVNKPWGDMELVFVNSDPPITPN